MRIDTSEPALTALFEKGQVGLIRTEFMRKDDVIANTLELLEIYKKENAALAAENERLRKAGDGMAKQYFDLYWIMNAESTSRHEPASITDWEAAKEGGRK